LGDMLGIALVGFVEVINDPNGRARHAHSPGVEMAKEAALTRCLKAYNAQ
jgi:hypothetical protein